MTSCVPRPARDVRRTAVAAACLLAAAGTGLASSGGLPGHFGFGLANGARASDWMVDTGVPWDYRYQYLAGDCTGENWADWNSPAGQFVTYYADESEAAGLIPVFSYYLVVPSSPSPGSEDYTQKLPDAWTMWNYYENWKLLMQKCAEFGGTVIVHVEPDLWGFIECDHGESPQNCYAAVDASGQADVAGLEDSARGYAKALVRMRNAYAPNVLVAWHLSGWATGTDVVTNQGDPVQLGSQVAAFYANLGADFDLIFADMSDRDSGYYQVVLGQPNRWMDDADYARYREYVATVSSATGLKVVLWQLPCGNTLYRTCDNTWGHFQDNRAEYFLLPGNRSNTQAYADAGVIGCLFGPGTSGCTTFGDSMGDGITNPAAVNGNDLVAEYADDDGGFFRTASRDYYASGPVAVDGVPGGGGSGGCLVSTFARRSERPATTWALGSVMLALLAARSGLRRAAAASAAQAGPRPCPDGAARSGRRR